MCCHILNLGSHWSLFLGLPLQLVISADPAQMLQFPRCLPGSSPPDQITSQHESLLPIALQHMLAGITCWRVKDLLHIRSWPTHKLESRDNASDSFHTFLTHSRHQYLLRGLTLANGWIHCFHVTKVISTTHCHGTRWIWLQLGQSKNHL